jgi:hypothetical protein
VIYCIISDEFNFSPFIHIKVGDLGITKSNFYFLVMSPNGGKILSSERGWGININIRKYSL